MKIETKELTIVRGQVSKAVSAAESLAIKTKEDLPVAVELLARIKKVGGLLKEKKEGITQPLNIALKNARDLFRPIEESWANAEKIVKDKMLVFNAEEQKRIAEIAQKVEEGNLSMKAGAKKIEKLQTTEANRQSENGEIQFRIHKLVVVENPNLVPDEYWEINTVKLRADVLRGIEVPGTKIVEEKVVAGIVK